MRDNLDVKGNTNNAFTQNIVYTGSVRVSDIISGGECRQQTNATVKQNEVFGGSLWVNCHQVADVLDNTVRGGNLTCKGNDFLDSRNNDSLGGRTRCSRSLDLFD